MLTQPERHEEDWTIGRLLSWTAAFLTGRGVSEARLVSEVLLSQAMGCRRIDLYAAHDRVPETDQLTRFRDWVRQAAAHEPVAYLVGEKEFFSLPMYVSPDVLIPRPETETLVEVAVDRCVQRRIASPRFLDLGTGSGCVAVALLTQLRDATAVASDISKAALSVAQRNAERHGVAERLQTVQADRLALPESVLGEGTFDMILSNPPYVAVNDMDSLAKGVRDFEPALALTDQEDGLSFYRTLSQESRPLLGARGVVVVEVGDGQARRIVDIMTKEQPWCHVGTWEDRTVGQERVLMFSPT